MAFAAAFALIITSCGSDVKKEADANDSGKDSTNASLNAGGGTPATVPAVLTLSLCEYIVEPTPASDGYNNAFAFIRRNKLNPLDFTFDNITKKMVDDLNTEIINTHPAGHGCAGFVPAIIITPGLEGNTLRFLYQSCYVCTNSYTDEQPADFTINGVSSTYSIVQSGSFAQYANAANRIAEYKNNIQFKDGANWRGFDTSGLGDTRSIMAPLQKLTSVMVANSVTKLSVNHFAVTVNSKHRQSVVFGSADHPIAALKTLLLEKKFDKSHYFFSGEFSGKFADRSNLCPPNCSTLKMVPCSDSSKNCQN